MTIINPNLFHYFSPVKGRVVARYGSTGYIGAVYVKGRGFVVDPEMIVRIPDANYRPNLKAYRRAVKDGSLIERTEADYEAYLKKNAESFSQPEAPPPKRSQKNKENAQ